MRLIGIERDGESRPSFIPYNKIAASMRHGEALTEGEAAFTMRPVVHGSRSLSWFLACDARVVEWQTRQT